MSGGGGFWAPLPVAGGGAVGAGEFYGAYITRLSNYTVANEEPFPFDTQVADSAGIWDPGDPSKLTIQREGWYWVGANVTTLGTAYSGPANQYTGLHVLKNWDGVSAQLGYYVAFENFYATSGDGAHGNSLLQPVYLEVGDFLELSLIGPTGSGLLVESNPSDGLPSGFPTDTGPGTLSPHFYVIWAQGDGGAGGAGEVLMADGVTPPEPLTNEAGTDWLYEDV